MALCFLEAFVAALAFLIPLPALAPLFAAAVVASGGGCGAILPLRRLAVVVDVVGAGTVGFGFVTRPVDAIVPFPLPLPPTLLFAVAAFVLVLVLRVVLAGAGAVGFAFVAVAGAGFVDTGFVLEVEARLPRWTCTFEVEDLLEGACSDAHQNTDPPMCEGPMTYHSLPLSLSIDAALCCALMPLC